MDEGIGHTNSDTPARLPRRASLLLNRHMMEARSPTPRFSVIIPTYRRPDRPERCLRGLRSLDYPRGNFEVLVVDDGGATNPDVLEAPSPVAVRLLAQKHAGYARLVRTPLRQGSRRPSLTMLVLLSQIANAAGFAAEAIAKAPRRRRALNFIP